MPWGYGKGVDVKLYLFFNLDAKYGSVINATPRLRYPRETAPVRLVDEAE